MNPTFGYEENSIICLSPEGLPITGNKVCINVLGQDFVEYFDVLTVTPEFKDDNRAKAFLFGKALQKIGKMIEMQAALGKPRIQYDGMNWSKSF